MTFEQIQWLANYTGESVELPALRLIQRFYQCVVEREGTEPLPTINEVGLPEVDQLAISFDYDAKDGNIMCCYVSGGPDADQVWKLINEFPGFRIVKKGDSRELYWAPGIWPPLGRGQDG